MNWRTLVFVLVFGFAAAGCGKKASGGNKEESPIKNASMPSGNAATVPHAGAVKAPPALPPVDAAAPKAAPAPDAAAPKAAAPDASVSQDASVIGGGGSSSQGSQHSSGSGSGSSGGNASAQPAGGIFMVTQVGPWKGYPQRAVACGALRAHLPLRTIVCEITGTAEWFEMCSPQPRKVIPRFRGPQGYEAFTVPPLGMEPWLPLRRGNVPPAQLQCWVVLAGHFRITTADVAVAPEPTAPPRRYYARRGTSGNRGSNYGPRIARLERNVGQLQTTVADHGRRLPPLEQAVSEYAEDLRKLRQDAQGKGRTGVEVPRNSGQQ